MIDGCLHGARLGAALTVAREMAEVSDAPCARYGIECLRADGTARWRDLFTNIVVTTGKNDLLTQYFKGSGYTAAWFVGLVDAAGFAAISAADTMASHVGWAESTAYSNANRPTLSLGSVTSGSVDNSASAAAFTINAAATLKGAFIATNGTKGGSGGTLYSAGMFPANRAVAPGDTLNVTVTLTAS
jgi:hypothetical protein